MGRFSKTVNCVRGVFFALNCIFWVSRFIISSIKGIIYSYEAISWCRCVCGCVTKPSYVFTKAPRLLTDDILFIITTAIAKDNITSLLNSYVLLYAVDL